MRRRCGGLGWARPNRPRPGAEHGDRPVDRRINGVWAVSTEGHTHRVALHDQPVESVLIVVDQVKCSGVGSCDRAGLADNALQERIDVILFRQRGRDLYQSLERLAGHHGSWICGGSIIRQGNAWRKGDNVARTVSPRCSTRGSSARQRLGRRPTDIASRRPRSVVPGRSSRAVRP